MLLHVVLFYHLVIVCRLCSWPNRSLSFTKTYQSRQDIDAAALGKLLVSQVQRAHESKR